MGSVLWNIRYLKKGVGYEPLGTPGALARIRFSIGFGSHYRKTSFVPVREDPGIKDARTILGSWRDMVAGIGWV